MIVSSGRYLDKDLYQNFDIIIEINNEKHYLNKGFSTKKGIDY